LRDVFENNFGGNVLDGKISKDLTFKEYSV